MSDLSPECRRYLRGTAREQDESKAYQSFFLTQAEEDVKVAKQKQTAADRRREKAKKSLATLNKFDPILSLKKLKKLTIDGVNARLINKQLRWHKRIGGDVNIPNGYSTFRKAKAWVAMVKAVQRYKRGISRRKLEGTHV